MKKEKESGETYWQLVGCITLHCFSGPVMEGEVAKNEASIAGQMLEIAVSSLKLHSIRKTIT